MADIVVFGQVAVDIVIRVPAAPLPGEHVTGHGLGWRVGGSSANLACGLSSAGHDVRLVGPVGDDDIGGDLLDELSRLGVDTGLVIARPGPSPRTLILLDEAGERTMISLGDDPTRWHVAVDHVPDLSAVDCVFVESYERYPASISEAAPKALLVTSPPVAGFSSWPADLVVGSAAQFGDDDLMTPFEAVRATAGARLQWVVLTRGDMGAEAFGPDQHLTVAAKPAKQVDATGAGDAFNAGLLHGLLEGADIATALGMGVSWGAKAVSTLQSLPPTWAEL